MPIFGVEGIHGSGCLQAELPLCLWPLRCPSLLEPVQAILARKLVLPEVYDLMNRVQVGKPANYDRFGVKLSTRACVNPVCVPSTNSSSFPLPLPQELMVQSQAAPVRSACSSALLQFLLDYPLGGWEGANGPQAVDGTGRAVRGTDQ